MPFLKRKYKLGKVQVDPQDPLPESNWFWRRLVLIGSLGFLLMQRSWEEYVHIFNAWTDYLILAILILYTVAPSAEQVAKMFGMVALFAPGRTFNEAMAQSRSKAEAEADSENVNQPSQHTTVVVNTAKDNNEGELPEDMRVKRPK